jgi:putative protease
MVTRQRERYSNARIDDAVTGKPFTPELLLELECLSNRSYTGGMKERCRAQDYKNHISGHRESNRSQIVGEVLRVREDGWAEVETKNCFAEGDQLTVIHPSGNRTATLEAMRNQEGVVFDVTQDGPIGVWLPLPSPSHGALLARLI